MRHFLRGTLTLPIALLAPRVHQPSTTALLVAPPRFSLLLSPAVLRARRAAVNLSPIAPRADVCLAPAPAAAVQPVRVLDHCPPAGRLDPRTGTAHSVSTPRSGAVGGGPGTAPKPVPRASVFLHGSLSANRSWLLLPFCLPLRSQRQPLDQIGWASANRRAFRCASTDGVMGKPNRYSKELRERAVRMVQEQRESYASEWAAMCSIAEKLGCTAETLRTWVRQAERDAGKRPGLTTTERERLKELERENRELRRTNEILRKASAFFAQAELDRRPKQW
jgi:transposase